MHESEFKIIAVSDISGGYYRKEGLDIPGALHHTLKNGSLQGYTEADSISNEQLLTLDVDMLVPSALGNVIHEGNVDSIRAKYIIEGANNPVHPMADEVLYENGVVILPDILANAGGVTVSYFEWVQNLQQFSWNLNTVRERLEEKMVAASSAVFHLADEQECTYREAAYQIAAKRLKDALYAAGF
jgi:glutamate dehydrogenase (NAD(P)+)